MPHLKVFNKYLRIGGDDVSAPLCLFMVGRIMWITVLVTILYLDFTSLWSCTNGVILLAYLLITIKHLGFALCLDCVTLNTSLRGTIVRPEERSGMSGLIKIRFTLSAMQVLYSILGIIGLSLNSRVPCDAKRPRSDVNKFIFSVIIVSQFLDSCTFFTCAAFLIGSAPRQPEEIKNETQSEIARVETRFRKFLKWIERYGFGEFGSPDINSSIEQVANVITKYFHNHGFLDAVPSDIVAGIILVRTEQRTNRYRAWRDACETASRMSMNFSDYTGQEIKSAENRRRITTLPYGVLRNVEIGEDDNKDELKLIARSSVYAAVIYNRIIPLDKSYWKSLCKVCQKSPLHPNFSCVQLCCCCWIGSVTQRPLERSIQEDQPGYSVADIDGLNFVGFNRIGVSSFSQELAETELVFISFRNDTIHKPFAIFVDHQEQNIVITIRGTLSVEDAITDVACDPVEVRMAFGTSPLHSPLGLTGFEQLTEAGEKWGFHGRGKWAHSGMLRAAMAMREEIEEAQILERIYHETNEERQDVGLHQPIFNPVRFSHIFSHLLPRILHFP